jgi:hypothetical protein
MLASHTTYYFFFYAVFPCYQDIQRISEAERGQCQASATEYYSSRNGDPQSLARRK